MTPLQLLLQPAKRPEPPQEIQQPKEHLLCFIGMDQCRECGVLYFRCLKEDSIRHMCDDCVGDLRSDDEADYYGRNIGRISGSVLIAERAFENRKRYVPIKKGELRRLYYRGRHRLISWFVRPKGMPE